MLFVGGGHKGQRVRNTIDRKFCVNGGTTAAKLELAHPLALDVLVLGGPFLPDEVGSRRVIWVVGPFRFAGGAHDWNETILLFFLHAEVLFGKWWEETSLAQGCVSPFFAKRIGN
jgi:hypothetical protein